MAGNLHDGFRVFLHEVSDATDLVIVGVADHGAVGRELHFDGEGLDGLGDTLTAGVIHLCASGGVRAQILAVDHAIVIAVQLTTTAVYFRTARGVGTLVSAVSNAVAIRIRFAAIAVNGCACRRAGALVTRVRYAIAISICRTCRLCSCLGHSAGKGKTDAQRDLGVEGALINAMEFTEIAAQRYGITDVIAEAGADVHPRLIVVTARGTNTAIVRTEVCMAGTQGNIRIPGFVRACKVVGAIDPDFVELGLTRHVLAIGIGARVQRLNGPMGTETVFHANPERAGLAQVALVVKQLETRKRVDIDGFLTVGDGRSCKGGG